MKINKILVAGCMAVIMIFPSSVIAADTINDSEISFSEEKGELTKEEKEFWENYDWDVLDLSQSADEYEVKEESSDFEVFNAPTDSANINYASNGGQWIQEDKPDGRWWYRHADGSYTTNDWEYIDNRWYYFDENGWMKTGWIKYKNNWYFCGPSGAMLTGWIKLNNVWYYCNSSGVMQTGWEEINGTWYYFNENNGTWIDNDGTRMIQHALKYEGNPYVYGGNSLTNRIDCSGYVQQISAKVGITTPRVSQSQYNSSKKISYSDLRPGDLVFFSSKGSTSSITHVAFYVGRINDKNNQIIHAANSKEGIIVSDMRSNCVGYGTYWR